MPNTTKPLTNTQIKQAKPKEKEFNLADGGGLYLRIKPSGAKLWLFNYSRPVSKKRANMSLGRYPDLPLGDARVETQKLRDLLAKGIDPLEHRKDQTRNAAIAHTNTLQHITEKWITLKKDNISDSYYRKIDNRLSKYILPKLGSTPIYKINAVDAIEAITPLANEGKLETVKKLCRWINEIMVFAVNTGVIHANPLSGIGKAFNSPKTVNLPTLKPEELPELMYKLHRSKTKLVTRCLIEWQLHTMVRPGEAAATSWDEIDRKALVWKIPAERMKKNRPHIVPLSAQSLKLLEILEPLSGNREFVFPSDHNPRRSANSQSANRALGRMGFQGRLVSHGLRSLASTTLNENGWDPEVIESALAHVDKNSIRAAYNRAEYLEQRRKMMAWWSNYIDRAASGNLDVAEGRRLRAVN